jgi:hypothetical protein
MNQHGGTMAEQTKPTTPIKDAQAGIGGLRIVPGSEKSAPRIEFRLSFTLNRDTESWVTYLARCVLVGSAYVDLRSPQPALDEAADEDPADQPPAEKSDLFPGWPKACGKQVHVEGMNTVCHDGHVTTTPLGEPCNHIDTARCPIVWQNDLDNRCERDEGHAGAHHYPTPPLRDINAQKPDDLEF